MPRPLVMWLTAGGAALASAALTYAVTRPSAQPVLARVRWPAWCWRSKPAWCSRSGPACAARSDASPSDVPMTVEDPIGDAAARPAPNSAFEAYRQEMLKQLSEDQQAFHAFLERLRHAQDRAEFDAFMADRKAAGGARA